jgi:hypothetical protein
VSWETAGQHWPIINSFKGATSPLEGGRDKMSETRQAEKTKAKVFNFLYRLQHSGTTNMFGAPAVLMDNFQLTRKEATQLFTEWTEQWNEADYKSLTVF